MRHTLVKRPLSRPRVPRREKYDELRSSCLAFSPRYRKRDARPRQLRRLSGKMRYFDATKNFRSEAAARLETPANRNRIRAPLPGRNRATIYYAPLVHRLNANPLITTDANCYVLVRSCSSPAYERISEGFFAARDRRFNRSLFTILLSEWNRLDKLEKVELGRLHVA